MDETYIKVRGGWMYLYRAVDKSGKTVDFHLSRTRDVNAAMKGQRIHENHPGRLRHLPSLYGTNWAVFEPNDEPLWSELRLNVGSFMRNLFRQGAFQGSTQQPAYFVQCDSGTTTQTDIDNGVVNILVGFAPLQPAEFIVIKISQITSDSSN
jgi:hypothetical protein